MEYYAIEVKAGCLSRVDVDWLSQNCEETYVIKTQEKWEAGYSDSSAMYNCTTIVVYFCSKTDAVGFKLQFSYDGPYEWKP